MFLYKNCFKSYSDKITIKIIMTCGNKILHKFTDKWQAICMYIKNLSVCTFVHFNLPVRRFYGRNIYQLQFQNPDFPTYSFSIFLTVDTRDCRFANVSYIDFTWIFRCSVFRRVYTKYTPRDSDEINGNIVPAYNCAYFYCYYYHY